MKQFKINENTLHTKEEKGKITDVVVKHWNVLDVTGMRTPTLKTGIIPKHKIVTFGLHKRAKVRPLNPELSKNVKEVLLN